MERGRKMMTTTTMMMMMMRWKMKMTRGRRLGWEKAQSEQMRESHSSR
jgi:hypothetical protein